MSTRRTVPEPSFTEVAKGVFAYVQPDGGWMLNNTGLLINDDGSNVMIDTTSTEQRNRALIHQVREATGDVDPKVLINTHHHADHTFGNWLLPTSTSIIGHVRCREDVLEWGLVVQTVLPEPDYGQVKVRPPDVTFTDSLDLHFGDREVKLVHLGPAHTSNDVIAWLPREKTLFSGDLVFNGGHPFLMDGSLVGYQRALATIRALQPEIIVPGHGPVCRGDEIATVLTRLSGYVEFLSEVATAGHAEGRSPKEAAIAAKTHLGPFAAWQEAERLVGNLHRAYSELDGHELGSRIDAIQVFTDMIELNGGPITCLA